MEMKLSQLQMISGPKEGLKVNYIDQPELPLPIPFASPSIQFHSDCHLTLDLTTENILAVFASDSSSNADFQAKYILNLGPSSVLIVSKVLGSKTIKACG